MTKNNAGPDEGVKFAEIEYEFKTPDAPDENETGRVPESGYSYLLPGRDVHDPIKKRFFEMRALASDNPFARNDAGVFYKQAVFMEDFEDDYAGDAKFFMYFPYYQHMGYEQLRTYFTWRSKVRRGEISATSLSYVFLYVYELLSGVGATDPEDGLKKLTDIRTGFEKYGPALNNYLPGWIKDYHVYYAAELKLGFAEYAQAQGALLYYPDEFMFEAASEESLLIWNAVSRYDITKSAFYNAGNEDALRDCFAAVLNRVGEFFAKRGAEFEQLFIYGISGKTVWYPFRRALFYDRSGRPDITLQTPGRESYCCVNGRWTARIPLRYDERRDVAGYLLKKTEACLRGAVKFKYKITPDQKTLRRFLRTIKAPSVTVEELDAVIEKAVAEYYREKNRVVVTVDRADLTRIRRDAAETQNKLTVPDDMAFSFAKPSEESQAPVFSADAADPEDGWDALKKALSLAERKALKAAIEGGADFLTVAAESGVMPEILASGINEKAADLTGDNILEYEDGAGVRIFDEYKEKAAETVG